MTESSEVTTDTIVPPAVATEIAHRNTRLFQVLAWVGIVAGVLFIVAVVFFSGFFAGRTTDGYGWHRGVQNGQMRPDGMMAGGCPMMQMQPGGMGPGGMPGGIGPGGMGPGGMGPGGMPGGMGPGGMNGTTSTVPMPTPPTGGQR